MRLPCIMKMIQQSPSIVDVNYSMASTALVQKLFPSALVRQASASGMHAINPQASFDQLKKGTSAQRRAL